MNAPSGSVLAELKASAAKKEKEDASSPFYSNNFKADIKDFVKQTEMQTKADRVVKNQ